MSDTPDLAARLAAKFDYTNTFYHQAPVFDVTQPDERDRERYDFILSSEVLEHVRLPSTDPSPRCTACSRPTAFC